MPLLGGVVLSDFLTPTLPVISLPLFCMLYNFVLITIFAVTFQNQLSLPVPPPGSIQSGKGLRPEKKGSAEEGLRSPVELERSRGPAIPER